MDETHAELPPEIWVHILGFLSTDDKLCVRTCSKFFRKLVDQGSLWKDYTVVLDFKSWRYDSRFWAILRRRKIRHVVVESTKPKDWKQVALSLPAVTTVVMKQVSQNCIHYLKDFPKLKRLAIRNKCSPLFVDNLLVSEPRQLTHLDACDIIFPNPARKTISAFILQFTNLTHVVCHLDGNRCDPVELFNAIISGLPRLEHLSWGMNRWYPIVHDQYDHYNIMNRSLSENVNGRSDSLTSLELVNFVNNSLSKNTMSFLPRLRSLTVLYKYSNEDMEYTQRHDNCCLKTWLSDLHQLSTLVLVNGPHLHEYVDYFPATVTSLSLSIGRLSTNDLVAIAPKVPNLLHLHLGPWPPGVHPHMFPKLKSIKIHQLYMKENQFLSFLNFPELTLLEILNGNDGPTLNFSELVKKFKILSNDRIGVITSSERRNPLACMCAYEN